MPSTLSNVWFSRYTMTTCRIGLAPARASSVAGRGAEIPALATASAPARMIALRLKRRPSHLAAEGAAHRSGHGPKGLAAVPPARSGQQVGQAAEGGHRGLVVGIPPQPLELGKQVALYVDGDGELSQPEGPLQSAVAGLPHSPPRAPGRGRRGAVIVDAHGPGSKGP